VYIDIYTLQLCIIDHPDLRTSKPKFVYAEHKQYVVHKYGAETPDTKLCRILCEVKK